MQKTKGIIKLKNRKQNMCKTCNRKFYRFFIDHDGKVIKLNYRRKYCLRCVPFGTIANKINSKANKKVKCNLCNQIFVYKSGKRMTINVCKTCKESQIKNNNKEKAIKYKGGKCQTCGYNKCIDALVFHHKNPNKKSFGISNKLRRWGWNTIKKEIKHCILLCANCHIERHHATRT